jgi:tetratricopeptide (TPR) repeat protein
MWRRVRGRILARAGKLDDAERLMREALELVAPADAPGIKADVLVDYAEVLRAGGREKAAAEMLDKALVLYDEKGNTVAADRIRGEIRVLRPVRAS